MSSPAWSAAPTRPSPTAWSAASGAPTSPWNASRTASISAATTSPEWPSSCCVSVARPAPAVPCCTRKPGCSAPIAPAACASPPTGWRSARSAG
ncbi:hypothetical protein H123_26913 [Pseudomonas aeruginosa PA21_ST175]|nr:hypothetical protein CF510_13609 [Pseudomonas aeruginosa PADK2_CF510]EME90923.1 hypothetical protein H123_26913 [Pseudomonas aeruginosa PA21_ST175]ENH90653.1 hypothetical protein H734_25691 [Pseudomonas aeruginosa PA45]